ncbi:hypothetical protein CC85DRAFT_328787 [Cutaneotrichosporon oleaginosum]|uniref:Uncharacterized protein n=1 Tax=Cutaneotrichosporon oleaginosum TaxID=879819 RepID=A0A0J0XL29_9TREE|nr:uncharacterized protein CC85DRAFT_328787 [Cutaneotrichosporon oleaginosum]KLT41777.1 hypothetical protein CC85DRAFT_328787 [Cutaneotrichosporon oleaginosum]TXT12373.1 hypothetical protein COLE_02783 [Cutaneotrichosporon oleaginosum]
MKLSLAVVALAATASAFNPGPGPGAEVDFDFSRFRVGHAGIERDLPAEVNPRAQEIAARDPHFGGHHREHAPIFVEAGRVPSQRERKPCHGKWGGFSFSGLLSRLGLGEPKPWSSAVSRYGHHDHMGDHHEGEHKHHGHHHDKAPKKPEDEPVADAEFAHILPIFGEDKAHAALEAQLKAQADDDEDKHHHKHKEHKHHHKHKDGKKLKHKHKHHHGHKHHKDKEYSLKQAGFKLCDALKELPPALRGFVLGALIGSILQVFFSLIFLAVRLRHRGSREARRARRAERKEARKAAKAAYKANKAARKTQSKAAEAGYADIEEALPSYAEGETDALVVRQ